MRKPYSSTESDSSNNGMNSLSVDLWDAEVVEQKLIYTHNNPLQEKWNLATHPADYWYSSYRFYHGGQDDFGFLIDFREEY